MRIAAALIGMLAAAGAWAGDPARDAERHLLVLKTSRAIVGISPRLAGRIVVFRTPAGANLLAADPAYWAPDAKLPALAASWDYPAVNGAVVWTGPQKEWWLHQDISEEWKKNAYNWPPDPWTEFAPFEVVKKTKTSAILRGPASPVTGLRLTKEVAISRDGKVAIKVSAENTRKEESSWDLWSNTRVPSKARVWVPVAGNIRLDHGSSTWSTESVLDYEVRDGYFRFLDEEPLPGAARTAKAFLVPSRGLIAAFEGDRVFVKRFTPASRPSVHPDQGVVELYRRSDRNPAGCLVEIEFHGALTRLPPGGTMAIEESWEIVPYPGPSDPASQAAFLRGL